MKPATAPDFAAWLTKAEAAGLACSPKSIERLAAAGQLQTSYRPRPGSGLRPEAVYHPADVDRLAGQRAPRAFPLPFDASNENAHPPQRPDAEETAVAVEQRAAAGLPTLAAIAQLFAPPRQPARFLTLEEAAEATGLTVPYLRSGALRFVRDGRVRKVRHQDLAVL